MYHVFLVDDEPLTLEYLSQTIPAVNCEWEIAGCAGDGSEALEFLQNRPVHLVITDIKMPGMNGLKLAQQLKEKNPEQEIVILSGYDEFALAQQAMRLGVMEYLLKPIKQAELSVLLDKIQLRLQNRENHNRQLATLHTLLTSLKPAGEKLQTKEQNPVQAAVQYIYEHFTEAITLSQVADVIHVSPNYLSRQFHEQTGESYIKFITRLRMEYAGQILSGDPFVKISAVAEVSGYYSLKHFNYAFKEYYKMTPGQYQRKQAEANHNHGVSGSASVTPPS